MGSKVDWHWIQAACFHHWKEQWHRGRSLGIDQYNGTTVVESREQQIRCSMHSGYHKEKRNRSEVQKSLKEDLGIQRVGSGIGKVGLVVEFVIGKIGFERIEKKVQKCQKMAALRGESHHEDCLQMRFETTVVEVLRQFAR